MSYVKELNKIKAGQLDQVYVLFGTEYYFIDQFKKAMIEASHDQTTEDDMMHYDLREIAIQDVTTDVETFPFFSERKLIFATNAMFLQAKPERMAVTHDVTMLETYLKNPVTYSTLVMIAPYEKLDARKKITKQLKKTATMIDCNPLKGSALHQFIKQIVTNEAIHITGDALALLESEYQTNLYMLQKELEKLALFAGEGETITKEMAEEIISPSNTFNALQFVDAVLKKDLAQAIKIYKGLEKMKEEPIGLIALLAYQFRVILQVKLLKNKGYPLDRMKSELKVHPYVVQLAAERSNYFSEQMLKHIMYFLTETDENIKRGRMGAGIAFELLLYKLVTVGE
jgi:DNA polymerase-3 subunit delta